MSRFLAPTLACAGLAVVAAGSVPGAEPLRKSSLRGLTGGDSVENPRHQCTCSQAGELCSRGARCCGGATCQHEGHGTGRCVRASWQTQWEELHGEWQTLCNDPAVQAAWNAAAGGLDEYVMKSGNPMTEIANPWVGRVCSDMGHFFGQWLTFLPNTTDGLQNIQELNYWVRHNTAGIFFLNRLESRTGGRGEFCPEVLDWTTRWLAARQDYMDSEESTKLIPQWVAYVNDNTTSPLSDYEVPETPCTTPTCGFTSFNAWFSRNLKNDNLGPNPPRPISNKDDDSILVAPADSEINFILSSITMETLLPVKTRSIDVRSLLGNSQFAEKFNRGTAISCVLMPNNYHRFHAPVTGSLVESRLVEGFYFGISNGATWFNKGNTGDSDMEFSTFEDFQRAYYVYNTSQHGFVAQVSVGLAEISSVNPFIRPSDNRSTWVGIEGSPEYKGPLPMTKGDQVGYFKYGGSLNILFFEPGVFSSIAVLMGQRLGQLSEPVVLA